MSIKTACVALPKTNVKKNARAQPVQLQLYAETWALLIMSWLPIHTRLPAIAYIENTRPCAIPSEFAFKLIALACADVQYGDFKVVTISRSTE